MANQIEIFNVSFGDTIDSIHALKSELKQTRVLFEQAKPNTVEFQKYSTEVKRLDISIKTLNQSTKDNVNALGGVSKAAKFVEGSYGSLKQKIKEQSDALLELNVDSQEFNNTQADLIKLQNQRIEIEGKIPSLFQARIKGAIDESNSLKQLKIDLKAAQSAQLNGDGKAAERVAELREKLKELKETSNTLQGSGVERLQASTGLLTEGLEQFDFEKIKTGFKGLGAAMSAIPIILLVEAVKALVENFDEVVKFTKELTDSFGPAEEAVNNLTKATEADTIVNNKLIESYSNEITLLEAKGGQEDKITTLKKKKIAIEILEYQNSVKLNSAKAAEKLLNESLFQSTEKILAQFFGGTSLAAVAELKINKEKADSIKENKDAILEANKNIEASKTALQVLDIETNKRAKEEAKKTTDFLKEEQARIADAENARIDKEEANEVAAKKFVIDSEIKAADEQKKIDKELDDYFEKSRQKELSDQVNVAATKLMQAGTAGDNYLAAQIELLDAQKKQELESTEITESQKAEIIEKYRQQEIQLKERTLANDFTAAQNFNNSLGELADAAFQVKRSTLTAGTEEDKKAAKQQFDVNKGFSIASALISGAVAVVNASASIPYIPVGLAASIAAATATTAAVAKIAATKFQYFEGGFTKQGEPTQQAESMGSAQFHNDEYVVPSAIKNRPDAQAHISILETMRQGNKASLPNISGFFDGGFTNRSISSGVISNASFKDNLMQAILNIPNPVVKVTDINKVSRSNEKSINVSSL